MPARMIYFCLGSNLGDRLGHLRAARDGLLREPALTLLRTSRVYASPSWGYASKHEYNNVVLEATWSGPMSQLIDLLPSLEAARGRFRPHQRGSRPMFSPVAQQPPPQSGPNYMDRTLDIDVIWMDGEWQNTPELTVPHPQAHMRAFVLVPLCELAPQLALGTRSASDWLQALPTESVAAITPVGGL